jgi:hypothetical protein
MNIDPAQPWGMRDLVQKRLAAAPAKGATTPAKPPWSAPAGLWPASPR